MFYVLIGLPALIVLFLIIVALQPPRYTVVRSALIAAPPAVVFAHVNDFHRWPAWSPWTKLDLSAKNTFEGAPAGEGAIFSWAGNKKIGEGKMTILKSKPGEVVQIKLQYFKPFPGLSTVEFTFLPQGDQTLTTWKMIGEKNFMSKAFCMLMNMDKMLGGSFEEGLANMKAIAESETVRAL